MAASICVALLITSIVMRGEGRIDLYPRVSSLFTRPRNVSSTDGQPINKKHFMQEFQKHAAHPIPADENRRRVRRAVLVIDRFAG